MAKKILDKLGGFACLGLLMAGFLALAPPGAHAAGQEFPTGLSSSTMDVDAGDIIYKTSNPTPPGERSPSASALLPPSLYFESPMVALGKISLKAVEFASAQIGDNRFIALGTNPKVGWQNGEAFNIFADGIA